MDKPIQANLGSFEKARYFTATADKKQAFFIGVVETPSVKNPTTGQYEDGTPRWYDAKFEGADADWVRTQLRAGDTLILFGDTVKQAKEVNGQTYRSTNLYVKSASLHPHLNQRISIVRAPQADQDHTQEQAVAQTLDAEPGPPVREAYHYDDVDPAVVAASIPAPQEDNVLDPLNEIYSRTDELVNKNRINPLFSSRIRDILRDTQGGPIQEQDAVREAISALPVAEREYLGSCVDQAAGQGRILSWAECEQTAALENPTVPDDPWAAVHQIRQELRGDVPAPAIAM
jgi:hypothetical protein